MTTTNLHLAPPPTKTAIVIELDQLRDLMAEYCAECGDGESSPSDMARRMYLSGLLQWLRRKVKEEGDGQRRDNTGTERV